MRADECRLAGEECEWAIERQPQQHGARSGGRRAIDDGGLQHGDRRRAGKWVTRHNPNLIHPIKRADVTNPTTLISAFDRRRAVSGS